MKKVITAGVFDYFHIGHLRLFENCKKQSGADYLIVAVQDGDAILRYKPEAKIFYSTSERVDLVKALRVVDEVVVYRDVDRVVELADFDIFALGEDHFGERFRRIEEWCAAHGKEVIRMKRTPGICSSEIKHTLDARK